MELKLPEKDTYHVLLADDSENDRLLLKNAMRQVPRFNLTAELPDGEAVITYFLGRSGFNDRAKYPLPNLLLLDLQMPLRDGFAVLQWLRRHRIEKLTIVVLTDSMQPSHIKKALDLGADLYQVKPQNNTDRVGMMFALESYLRNLATPLQPSFSRLFASAA